MDIDEPSKVKISTLEKLLIQWSAVLSLLSETQLSLPVNIPQASQMEKFSEVLSLQYLTAIYISSQMETGPKLCWII